MKSEFNYMLLKSVFIYTNTFM